MKHIPTPSTTEVENYLQKLCYEPSLKNDRNKEGIVVKLFRETCPNNTRKDEILLKVQILNLLYNTAIINTFAVAEHIYGLKDVDALLQKGDVGVVDKIARVTIKEKSRRFYSFATKYCCHHNPSQYPIFDNLVSKVLIHFNKQDHFCDFKTDDLKDYGKFKNVIIAFRKYHDLEQYSFRELDWYLWLLGKEFF